MISVSIETLKIQSHFQVCFSFLKVSVMKSHAASLLSAPSPATQNCLPFYYSSWIRVPGQSSLHKSLLPFSTEIWFSWCRLHHPISGASMWSGDSTSRTGGWPSPAIAASKSPELVWKHAILYSTLYWYLQIPTWFTEELRPDLVIVLISISANFLQNIKCTQN